MQKPEIITGDVYKELISKGVFSEEVMAPPNPIIPEIGPSPWRLCSEDHACGHGDHEHGGCRRTDTILAWEAENSGKYLPPTLEWGYGDHYFVHEGFMYYDKKFLEQLINEDVTNLKLDRHNIYFKDLCWNIIGVDPEFNFMNEYPNNITASLDDVRRAINLRLSGMPPFVRETEHFFVFQDITETKITTENISQVIKHLIFKTCIENNTDYGFTCHDPLDCIYMRGNTEVFLVDLTVWIKFTNPLIKKWLGLGITLEADTEIRFYPFKKSKYLTPQETRIIYLFGAMNARESKKTFVIVDL